VGFLRYELGYICTWAIVLAIAAALSFVCMKGKRLLNGVYVLFMLATIVFMVFNVFFMTICIRNAMVCYDIYKTAPVVSEKLNGYVSVPIYENNASSDGLGDNYLEFYKRTVDEYDGVLVQALNYAVNPITGMSKCEEYGQDYITVNENYLKLNPLYDVEGEEVALADTKNGEVVNVLLPSSKPDEEEKYVQLVGSWYDAKVNIIFYDDAITDIYSYNAAVGNEAYGKIDSPVIIVVSTENLSGEFVLSYCSLDCYFLKTETDSPYDELKPLLQETGILKVTPQTPSIASNYETELSGYMDDFKTYGTLSGFLSIGLILLALYTAILYSEIYREKFASKITEGHTILRCVRGHIIFKGVTYVVSLLSVYFAEQISGVGMNYYIILGTLVLDLFITMISCNRITKRNVSAVVKEFE
jgi:hypothetical protein